MLNIYLKQLFINLSIVFTQGSHPHSSTAPSKRRSIPRGTYTRYFRVISVVDLMKTWLSDFSQIVHKTKVIVVD